ncbi:MAG TPA: LLM class flavin-dependent oxidoreductase [Nocardioides sp.]|nr:LLM class flavin-dependent oxidoreductase [Nocardioides sp.]
MAPPSSGPRVGPVTGVVFRPQQPPEELRAVVEHAEAAGVAELWLWEDCFLEGGLTTAAAALAWSERLVVGVGLLPVPLRNPALAAMEIATLARLFPDRLVVTLGHGVQEWMAQVGSSVDSPLTLLREHTVAVRSLLAGDTVDVSGRTCISTGSRSTGHRPARRGCWSAAAGRGPSPSPASWPTACCSTPSSTPRASPERERWSGTRTSPSTPRSTRTTSPTWQPGWRSSPRPARTR